MDSYIGSNKSNVTEQTSQHPSETDSSASKPEDKQSGPPSREGSSVELTPSRISVASSGDSSIPRRLVRAIPDMRLFKYARKSSTAKETKPGVNGKHDHTVDDVAGPLKGQEFPNISVGRQESPESAESTRSKLSKRETKGFFRTAPKDHPARPPSSLNVKATHHHCGTRGH
jgi:hypothetical protein